MIWRWNQNHGGTKLLFCVVVVVVVVVQNCSTLQTAKRNALTTFV
jgi:hypothetical protein